MAAMLDDLIAQVIALEIRLHVCTERLVARTDDEALHDLRVATRRLRSLLLHGVFCVCGHQPGIIPDVPNFSRYCAARPLCH